MVEGRGVSLTETATRYSWEFTHQALPSSFYSRSYFYSFLPANISIHPLSQRKRIVRSCPHFTEEKGKMILFPAWRFIRKF